MDGLIPFVLKALKKKKTMRHYRSLSTSSHLLADADGTEPSPQGSLFMTPQHPRWHGGDGNIFMMPQHHRAARRLDEGDGNGEPPAPPPAAPAAVPRAMVPTVVRAKSVNMRRRRLPIMETPPPPLIRH